MKNLPAELSVIVPIYNEKKTLARALKRVLRRKEVFEVILVDDCSTDGSIDTVKHLLGSRIRTLQHKRNMGRGAGIVSGLKFARGKWAVIQDADLEQNPNDYPKMLAPLVKGEADFVIGNRWPQNTLICSLEILPTLPPGLTLFHFFGFGRHVPAEFGLKI